MARNAILWKIYPPSDSRSSVVVGSMHLNTSVAFNHLDVILTHMDEYESIAFEINMLEGKVGQEDFIVREERDLSYFLTDRQKKKVKQILSDNFNFPYELCIKLYPLFTVNVLTQMMLSEGEHPFLDEYLWEYAVDNEKEVLGLEDIKEHYNVLKEIPIKYQAQAFKNFIFNLSRVRKEYKKLSRLYAAQDIHAIYRLSKRSLGKIKHAMLYNRNKIMKKEILEIHRNKGPFMAIIGAAHLSGECGVLHNLRKRGYKIQPYS